MPKVFYRRRRKVCVFCAEKLPAANFKDINRLKSLMNEDGRILPRRQSGTCARHQRAVAQAIKRARFMALLPYTNR
jgi:small subunit ribosomal protein S18